MENLVPLGTGNSRFMKSNIPSSTTLAQLIQMLNNGTFPYDIGTINPAGISQQGTPLNKDTLLKDATAALFGLSASAVPDDVLTKIFNLIDTLETNSVKITAGSYVGTGTAGQSHPNTLTFGFSPKLVIIRYSDANNPKGFTAVYGNTAVICDGDQNYNMVALSWGSNSLSWYATDSVSSSDKPYYQMNREGFTYYYIAIGLPGGDT